MTKRFWFAGTLLLAVLLAAGAVRGQQTLNNVPSILVTYPDYIVHNGKIATMNEAGLNNLPGRMVEAMAVRGDQIQFVGRKDDKIHMEKNKKTKKK